VVLFKYGCALLVPRCFNCYPRIPILLLVESSRQRFRYMYHVLGERGMHAEGVITSVSMAMCFNRNFAEEWKKGMYALRSQILLKSHTSSCSEPGREENRIPNYPYESQFCYCSSSLLYHGMKIATLSGLHNQSTPSLSVPRKTIISPKVFST
jgi:hypothetical protein